MTRMNKKIGWVLLLVGLVASGCQDDKEPGWFAEKMGKLGDAQTRVKPGSGRLANMVTYSKDNGQWIPYEPGVLLVQFKKGFSESLKDEALAQELGLSRVERSRIGVDRMRLLTKEDVQQAAIRVAKDPRVAYAEPNWKIRLLNAPNDPRYNECWGLNNTGQTGGTVDADIDAVEAWDISIGSPNVVVAVLDTGVDYNHPDLSANIWNNSDETPGNGVDDDNNGYIDDVRGWDMEHQNNNPMDDYGHGTHCSGTIGAQGNNNLGVAGVNWRVSIMPVRIIGGQDLEGYCLDAAEGIHYAVDNGARVMSCSWWTVQHYSQTLEDAVGYANDHGVILVAAAGNEGGDNESSSLQVWPCEWTFDNIVCVAATDHNDHKASFSDWGAISVDVAAPGVDILSTVWPGGGYEFMSGTSMATPHTAGVVALMLSIRPELEPPEVKQFLFSTVDPIVDLQGMTVTGGRINAQRVMQAISGTPLPPVALAGGDQTVITGSTVTLDGSKSFDPNQDSINFSWQFYPPQHSSAHLSDLTVASPTFMADVCGLFQASLTVTDSGGLTSSPDQAKVHVMNQSEYPLSSGPYPANANLSWTINIPGAVVLSVHFASLDTESGYDYVHLLDATGQEWAKYDGQSGPFTSVAVDGDTIVLNLTSDTIVQGQGFVVDYVWWCDAGVCPPGQGDCDQDPSNGCETDTTADILNCGWCDHVCSFFHAAASCVDRVCQMGACEESWVDCDGQTQTGCEVRPESDANNCGSCGQVCAFDHAVAGCSNFVCAIASCESGWDNCNSELSDGCEQDVSADVNNCGSCHQICQLDHTVNHSCIDSVCYPMGDCTSDTSQTYESPHPYPNGYDHLWTITRPGVARIGLHFASLDTEANFDRVRIYDRNGVEYAVYEGQASNFDTPYVPGDVIQVRLTSDGSVVGQGFVIDAVRTCASGCDDNWGNCDGDPSNGCETNTLSDVNHCDGCGQRCGGANTQSTCQGGVCQVSTQCLEGFADCDADSQNGCEVDLNHDPQNCNTCGNLCSYPHASGLCNNGICQVGECEYGWGDCTTDPGCESMLLTDANHCGACENACTSLPHVDSAYCDYGVCQIGECLTTVDGIETAHPYSNDQDLEWTINHPGASAITVHFSLFDTESGYDYVALFNGQGVEIVRYTGVLDPFAADPIPGDTVVVKFHSDYVITSQGFIIDWARSCTGGSGCETGFYDCDGIPNTGCESEIAVDPQNCGSCGYTCTYSHASGVCSNSACSLGSCDAGWDNCDQASDNGCEISIESDVNHCGSCNHLCELPNAQAGCAEGACVVLTCTGGYSDCNANSADGCESEAAIDPQNCGTCGNVCVFSHAQGVCNNSTCSLGDCEAGYLNCNNLSGDGCEVRPVDDPINCGSCGFGCNLPNALAGCQGGQCFVASCNGTFDDCNGQSTDGCEIDVGSDVVNCGSCQNSCAFAHATALCEGGSCWLGVCETGFESCDGEPNNGCETELAVDPNNCGSCGVTCSYPNATGVCQESSCQMGACQGDYADCDSSAETGCEVALDSDAQNCGECGNHCQLSNARAVCESKTCQIEECEAGFADCDSDSSNGCELDVYTNVEHCGGCLNVCALANATPQCQMGACLIGSCQAGYDNCDGNQANGCEADLNSNNSCGSCGKVCSAEQHCEQGTCVSGPCSDKDGDGVKDMACGGDDCNDNDPAIHPGGEEICGDSIDQNCDGKDLACDCPDKDKDGYKDKACGGDDCNDNDATIRPGAEDICGDGIDQDCDGQDLSCTQPTDKEGCGGCSSSQGMNFLSLTPLVAAWMFLRRRYPTYRGASRLNK